MGEAAGAQRVVSGDELAQRARRWQRRHVRERLRTRAHVRLEPALVERLEVLRELRRGQGRRHALRREAALVQQPPELAEAHLQVPLRPARPPSLGTLAHRAHLERQLAAGLDGDGEARRVGEAPEGLAEQREVAAQHLEQPR